MMSSRGGTRQTGSSSVSFSFPGERHAPDSRVQLDAASITQERSSSIPRTVCRGPLPEPLPTPATAWQDGAAETWRRAWWRRIAERSAPQPSPGSSWALKSPRHASRRRVQISDYPRRSSERSISRSRRRRSRGSSRKGSTSRMTAGQSNEVTRSRRIFLQVVGPTLGPFHPV